MHLPTTAVHAGSLPPKPGIPGATPIVTATAWVHDDIEILDEALGDAHAGYVYARHAAPTQEAFEAAMTALERGHGAAAFASGTAALHVALLVAGAKPGATIFAATELYGGTQSLLHHLAANNGVNVVRVNVRDLQAVAETMGKRESPETREIKGNEGGEKQAGAETREILGNEGREKQENIGSNTAEPSAASGHPFPSFPPFPNSPTAPSHSPSSAPTPAEFPPFPAFPTPPTAPSPFPSSAITQAESPSILLFETLSNPLCRLADVPALIALAQQHGCRVVIDATFTSPALMQPLAWGADLVMHSATKYIGGHGDVLAGVVTARSTADAEALHATRQLLGPNLAPFDAYLALRGLRTLPLRMREQCHNALALAQWLQTHPRIARVYYPGLPTDPDHALATRLLPAGLFGAMLAFDLKNAGKAEALALMSRLRLVQCRATLGDVATLMAYPAHASHRALTPAQRHALGIGEGCLRLSVGIEAVADIQADLENALQA